MGRSPVEGRIVYRSELASWDEPLIDGCVAAGVERKDVVEDRAVSVAFKIKIGVICEIERRGFIGRCGVLDAEFVGDCQPVGDGDVKVTRIAFFSIWAATGEGEALLALLVDSFRVPNDFVEAFGSAMQVAGDSVWLVILNEIVGFALELEGAVCNTVAEATDDGAEVGRCFLVFGDGVVAERDIGEISIAVRHDDFGDNPAVVRDFDLEAVVVL